MKTARLKKTEIEKAVTWLLAGGVVAFPTDTVYGLGVIYDNEEALERLKIAKGRPDEKPIPTMVGSMEQLCQIAKVSTQAQKLAEAFMPGALTLIMKKQQCVPAYATNGLDTIGIRMPNDPFVLALLQECKKPLLVTSANLSGMPTGKKAEQVLHQLEGRIDAIVMGEAQGTCASTIVDVTAEDIKIVRLGELSESDIRMALAK